MSDNISRQVVKDWLESEGIYGYDWKVDDLPSTDPWIPCSERLPEHNTPVIVTYVNHRPTEYYWHIKDKPFTGNGICFHGEWFWYTDGLEDLLAEYGVDSWIARDERIDGDIEITAWMPLPEPYKGGKG